MKSKELRILGRIALVIIVFVILTTILPALLSAKSDLGVLVGILSYVSVIVIGALRHREILEWFKDID